MKRNAGYRTTFYKELPDSAGHNWYVPVWSRFMPTTDHAQALKMAISEFELMHDSAPWRLNAEIVEVDEAFCDGAETVNAPGTKRVIRAQH